MKLQSVYDYPHAGKDSVKQKATGSIVTIKELLHSGMVYTVACFKIRQYPNNVVVLPILLCALYNRKMWSTVIAGVKQIISKLLSNLPYITNSYHT